MPNNIEITPFSSYVLEKSDVDHSKSINSQAEVNSVLATYYSTMTPYQQYFFSEYGDMKKFQENGWQIPALYRQAFEWIRDRNDEADCMADEPLGQVDILIPYRIDFETVQKTFYPQGSFERSVDGFTERLYGENDDLIVEIELDSPIDVDSRSDIGSLPLVNAVYSPLTRAELSVKLLYLPSEHRQQLQYLLGLPEPATTDVQSYLHHAIDEPPFWALNNKQSEAYDPVCQVDRADEGWKVSGTIREAILTQCTSDPGHISFPAYSLTSGNSDQPVLYTRSLYNCVGLVIFDRQSSKALMGHLITNDSPSNPNLNMSNRWCLYNYKDHALANPASVEENLKLTAGVIPPPYDSNYRVFDENRFFSTCRRRDFPLEWYFEVFGDEYFADSDPADLEITVLSTRATPDAAIDTLLQMAKTGFPAATIQSLQAQIYTHTDIAFDARTGEVAFYPKFCLPEFGCSDPSREAYDDVLREIIQGDGVCE